MEKLAVIMVVIACLMVSIANYTDAAKGARLLYTDLFGEE